MFPPLLMCKFIVFNSLALGIRTNACQLYQDSAHGRNSIPRRQVAKLNDFNVETHQLWKLMDWRAGQDAQIALSPWSLYSNIL